MKPKPQEKNKKATCRATQGRWQEMNRKQRREMMRKIRSDDLGLEDEAECPRRHAAVFSRLSRGLQGLHGVRNDHCWVFHSCLHCAVAGHVADGGARRMSVLNRRQFCQRQNVRVQ